MTDLQITILLVVGFPAIWGLKAGLSIALYSTGQRSFAYMLGASCFVTTLLTLMSVKNLWSLISCATGGAP
jgi:hypothetical protein